MYLLLSRGSRIRDIRAGRQERPPNEVGQLNHTPRVSARARVFSGATEVSYGRPDERVPAGGHGFAHRMIWATLWLVMRLSRSAKRPASSQLQRGGRSALPGSVWGDRAVGVFPLLRRPITGAAHNDLRAV